MGNGAARTFQFPIERWNRVSLKAHEIAKNRVCDRSGPSGFDPVRRREAGVHMRDEILINNRQSRRRGRGNNRGGNRPNTPSKGNAAQLLDKYKGLARDAQMSGDRVQAEYYLQFADHYFRVLEEYNAKQSDQQQQRAPRNRSNDDDDDGADEVTQQDKPKRTRRNRDDEQGEDKGPSKDKPKRARKPKKDDSDGGDSIADALPPAIGSDEEDEAA